MITTPKSDEDTPHTRVVAQRDRSHLNDLILIAVHRACDLREFDAARELLASAEVALRDRSMMPEAKRRLALDALVAAHERLWLLCHVRDNVITYLRVPNAD